MKKSLVFLLPILTLLIKDVAAQDIIIDWGANWKYYDMGNEPAMQPGNTKWYDVNYDDSAWNVGPAQLGYGEGDEATVTQSVITQYFRQEFNLNDGSIYDNIDVGLLHDDGAVVYLNGTELSRVVLPSGNINYSTFALYYVENKITQSNFFAPLQTGKNVIAVEVHQHAATSSDISFDFKLQANEAGFAEVIRGPYLQKAAPNTITIKWRTAQPTQSIVRYSTSINNLNYTESDLNLKTEHEVQINNLQPGTRYYYEVRNDNSVLVERATDLYFKTPPVTGQTQPVTAWILGDCGTRYNSQRSVRDAYYNYIGNNHTDMILFLGDNAYFSGTDDEYQYSLFENMYEDKLKNTISWSARGNHERYDPNAQTIPYYDIFSLPTNGECGGLASGTEAYYSFDYANIHFIVLDSYDTSRDVGATMYNWCEADIQNTTADWIVAFWHHPPYTKGSHNSDVEIQLVQMRENFLPMLEENGVDLVLSGHSHSYERSYFLNGHYGLSNTFDIDVHTVGVNGSGSGRFNGNGPYQKYDSGPNAGDGTVYITAGSSGKKSGGPLNHNAMYYSVNEVGSCVLEINEDTLQIKFLRETGAIEDYFTITKPATCTNELDLQNNIPSNIYNADLNIFSDGIIQNIENVHFRAGERIRLNSNFSAKAGSRFSAYIEGCQ